MKTIHKLLGTMIFACFFMVTSSIFAQQKSEKTKIRTIDQKEMASRQANGKIIKGNVMDGTEVLASVTVTLKGTRRGTETNYNGNFEFPLPLINGDVLVFDYLGYETKEVLITEQIKFLRVKMEESSEILEIVVLDAPQEKKLFKSKKSAFKKKNKKD